MLDSGSKGALNSDLVWQGMLKKREGEIIGNLGLDFEIEPNSKWRATQLWDIASAHAQRAFYDASRKPGHFAGFEARFTDDNILIQRYPGNPLTGQEPRLVFIFHGRVHGLDHYHPVVMGLSKPMIEALKLAGIWTEKTVH